MCECSGTGLARAVILAGNLSGFVVFRKNPEITKKKNCFAYRERKYMKH